MQIESQIYGAFTGWHADALFKLVNGQYWLQAEYKYKYEYQYRPRVVITQSDSGYEMEVEGMEDSVRVRRVDASESKIEGTFEGWAGDTTFQLRNGQVWKQSSYAYSYHYAYCPDIIIYDSGGGSMLRLADDDSHAIQVRRIR
jgi:hypothetical protein